MSEMKATKKSSIPHRVVGQLGVDCGALRVCHHVAQKRSAKQSKNKKNKKNENEISKMSRTHETGLNSTQRCAESTVFAFRERQPGNQKLPDLACWKNNTANQSLLI